MAHNLREFATQADYESATLEYPSVAWVTGNSEVYFEPTEPQYKLIATYVSGAPYSVLCDSATTITSADTRPSGYTYSAMTSAVVGNCITSIGDEAFKSCFQLASVTIPDSVTSIGGNAFAWCISLSSITIPDSVTTIGDNAFYQCGFKSVTIPNGTIGDSAFNWCPNLTEVTIGDGVTSIGDLAFRNSDKLRSVTIGSGITSIGDIAFSPMLGSGTFNVAIYATTPPQLGSSSLNTSGTIYVLPESVNLYKETWTQYANQIQSM